MFSPVKLSNKSGSHSSLSAPRSPKSRISKLEALKEHNSFTDIDSPKKSPEKSSSEEISTPILKNSSSFGRTSPKRKPVGVNPLVIETQQQPDDDYDLISPIISPVANFLHNYKGKFKVPENKAYKYTCHSELSKPIIETGNDSPRGKHFQKMKKKGMTHDKHVTYSAEYLRPIEEFIYPSLRPTKDEFERRRVEAKKNQDFSLPDAADETDDYELRWKIKESPSLIVKPDLSETLLYNINDKGESTLRNLITTNCKREIRKELDRKRFEERPKDYEVGVAKFIRKTNIMGTLFAKEVKSRTVTDLYKGTKEDLKREGKEDAGHPNALYLNLYKNAQQRVDRFAATRLVSISREESEYNTNKAEMEAAVPGLNESNPHFKGLMFYKIQNSRSEQKMNDMLNKQPPSLTSSSLEPLSELGGQSDASSPSQPTQSTSGIAKRQNKFQMQRASSNVSGSLENIDADEAQKIADELKRMGTVLPVCSMNTSYSCSVLSRIKRASNAIHNNQGANRFQDDADFEDNADQDAYFESTGQSNKVVEQKKRRAQDALLFREIKAGLIPEQLLKKIPRMGSMVSLDLSYFSLGDELCHCLGQSLLDLEMLHTLGLRANRLTFKSLNTIFTHVNVKGFRHLDISLNDMSGSSVPTLCDLLMRPDCRLSSLELEKNNLTRQNVQQICKAITFPETSWIMELSLARNQLDGRSMGAIADVLKYPGCSMSWLDLSWNSFDSESGARLADALAVNQTLTSIDLSANSLRDAGGQRIAAALLHNKNLQEIFLSLNNIGGKSCFIFSKVLRNHPSMARLNLSDNPLTEAGARSIFRTILRGLKCFVMMQNCTFTNETGLFNHSNPSLDSPYSLDLAEPYYVSVLSELIQMVNLSKTCRFSHLTYKENANDTKFIDISADIIDGETYLCHGSTPWTIPSSGVLKLHLTHRPRIPTVDMAIDELAYNTILAIVVNARSESDRKNWLFLMCMDAYFTSEQAQDLIDILSDHHLLGGGSISIVDFFYCIWSNIIDTVNLYDLYYRNLDATQRLSLIHSLSFEKFRFNWVNPTGHWRLDLNNKVQRSVMMQLIAMNGAESKASRRAKRGDTSQKGNYCNFRNEKLAGQEVEINIEYTKTLPWSGVLEFDYVTTTRPRPDAELISDEDFNMLLSNLDLSPRRRLCSKKSNLRLLELQLAVTKFYFSPERILKIMSCFSEDSITQVRVIVCMFSRLVELHNFESILRHVSASAVQDVLNKLGVLNCLNPLKPCLDLRLKLKYMDNRVLVHSYLQMSSAEGGDQLKQHPRSEVDIIALYASLGRLLTDSMEGTLMFTYCEVGEREAPLDWKLRKDAIHHFLVGNHPRHPAMTKLVGWYKELKAAGVLTLGPLDIQYADYQKQQALKNMNLGPKKQNNLKGAGAKLMNASRKTKQL